mmetsp:Transcript_25642/g.84429  ORF Transcript_25642/g.84429 Transcript_25642/m.84429 type:complete len:550 (+) Transcript_25642:33-1682(+)|eukprot:CAMPEP_0170133134 /NCGR_PEP_ID=MMETSP0033_2-20121228/1086_1 /TAXON_ID=195969 /ORGANISM="Dolichomastix tenuilepis, Strain CCMP3274" /LENGTH=549 /DNA_ID=CAMNT_0010368593 /DNA_START=12 /DNA_END=1661 /DNA_ORIENTATION=+
MAGVLQQHPSLAKGKPVLVCILDGYGENKYTDEWNAVHVAKTPTMDALRAVSNRYRTVQAHGTAVGLPSDADMGNSEVGHNALGAGKVIAQGASLVDNALESGSMFTGEGFKYIQPCFASGTLHLIGLLSSGGVHSRYDQLLGLMKGAVANGCKRLRLHVLLDGRDVPDGTSVEYMSTLYTDIEELSSSSGADIKVASGGGRMKVTMDRYEADWPMVELGWKAHVLGEAPHKFESGVEAVKELRKDGTTDQYIEPFVITDSAGKPVGTVEDGDAVVVFNFRADRCIEISKAFEYEDFSSFDRVRFPKVKFAGMMQYDGDTKLPANYLVAPPAITGVSGEWLCKTGLKTFACSETQKFGHVTFFWNGNRSGYFDESLETYVEIPSDNVPFNQAPLMKAKEITAAGVEAIKSGKYDMIRINYANPDMVGHTGDLAATVQAVEVCDAGLKELLDAIEEMGGIFLVTADHGNADEMVQRNKKGEPIVEKGVPAPLTSHTLAPVPVAIGGPGLPDSVTFRTDLPAAGLANVTPTFINLAGYSAPADMEPSLLVC